MKRQRLSTHCEYFQSELAHIIAMCDARIPYITLCEEVSLDSIINVKIRFRIRLELGLYQSESAHIIAMCDDRIPYITLCEEVSLDSIINLRFKSNI